MFHRKESVEALRGWASLSLSARVCPLQVETETQVEVVYSDEEVEAREGPPVSWHPGPQLSFREADEWLDVVAMNDIMQAVEHARRAAVAHGICILENQDEVLRNMRNLQNLNELEVLWTQRKYQAGTLESNLSWC